MTTRFLGTPYNYEQTGSEVSNSDSLIQEFQEFEAQAYSGTLFDDHERKRSSISASERPCGSHLSTGVDQTEERIKICNSLSTDGVVHSQTEMLHPKSSEGQYRSHGPPHRMPQLANFTAPLMMVNRESAPNQNNQPLRPMQPVLEDVTCDGDDEDASDLEDDSLDEAECLTSAQLSSCKQVDRGPSRSSALGHSLNYRAVQNARTSSALRTPHMRTSLPNTASTTNQSQHRTPSSLIKPYDCNTTPVIQFNPSAVSHSLSSLRLNTPSANPSWADQSPILNQCSLASTPLRRSESAQFTAQPIASVGNNEEQLELVNPHPVLPHAEEDPIETHDKVLAKMAASGAVWAPPEAMDSFRESSRGADNHTRWYSAEIEEEQVVQQRSEFTTPSDENDDYAQKTTRDTSQQQQQPTISSSTLAPTTLTSRSTQNVSAGSSNKTTKTCNNLSTLSQPFAQNASSEAPASLLSSSYHDSPVDSSTVKNASSQDTARSTDLTAKRPDESSGFVDSAQRESLELKARLDQEIALRKQQDDYIRQLQKYYDNLLAKHALAEVTIDQLRIGAKTRSESEDRAHGRANSQGDQRSSDLRLTDRFPHYRSQPLSALPLVQRGSMTPLGASTDQLLTCQPQLRYASTPMLISSTQPQGRSVMGSREWWCSTAQVRKPHRLETRPEEPNAVCNSGGGGGGNRPLSDRGLGAGNRQTDWNYGSRKVASTEYLCGTVPEEADHNCLAVSELASHGDTTGNRTQWHPSGPHGSPNSTKRGPVTLPKSAGHSQLPERYALEGDKTDDQQHQAYADTFSGSINQRPRISVVASELALDPEEVHEDLLTNVTEIKEKLDHMKRRITDQDDSLLDTDIRPIRTQYLQLKKYYHLAKRRWSANSHGNMAEFDPNGTLDKGIFQLRLQLDDIEACLQLAKPVSLRNSEAAFNFNRKSHLPDQSESLQTKNTVVLGDLNGKYPTVMDSGVLSSPSRSDREHDFSSMSSSPISKDNLCTLENLYMDLMERYNSIKQHNASETQAGQLYDIMKRLYDLAITVNGHSSVIPTPDELESVFQLDGDTRKLSEDLEKVIRMERELSAYSSYSNVSGRDQYLDRANGPPAVTSSSPLPNGLTQPHINGPPSTSNYTKNGALFSRRDSRFSSTAHRAARNQPTAPGSDGSSSAQDSGLSTPPISETKTAFKKSNNVARQCHLSKMGTENVLHLNPATLVLDSSPTLKSVPPYGAQTGHPSSGGLPGLTPTAHNRMTSQAVASTSQSIGTGSDYRIQGLTAVGSVSEVNRTHSAAHTDNRDTTERRMEALEAGIRFLQQKLMEVCDHKQAQTTSCKTPLVNTHASTATNAIPSSDLINPGVLYSSDTSKLASFDSTTNRVRRVKKHQRSSVAKRALQQQQQQQTDQPQCARLPESLVHPDPVGARDVQPDVHAGVCWPESDRQTMRSDPNLPMRFYGTRYNRWRGQNPPDPSYRDVPQYVDIEKAKVFNTQPGLGHDVPIGYHPNPANYTPAEASAARQRPESVEIEDATDEDSESTDQDTCSPQDGDSQVSDSTDFLEREQGIYFHPHREPNPRSILRRSSVNGSLPVNRLEPLTYGTHSRRTILPTPGSAAFDRSISVAYDLHQMPYQPFGTFSVNHLGGSMPVLGDPAEQDKYVTTDPTPLNDACYYRRRNQPPLNYHPSEGTLTPGALYRPPPPPKPAYLTEPHLVSTCGTCGGSGRVSTPFQSNVAANPADHIRRPLVPRPTQTTTYGRRVLSFANLVQDGSAIHRFGQTHIREYTEVGGRRYAVRELDCDTSAAPYPAMMMMHPCSSSGSYTCCCSTSSRRLPSKYQLSPTTESSCQSSSSGTSSAVVENFRPTGSTEVVAESNVPASRHDSEKIGIERRKSVPSAQDSAMQRLLATANSVRALTQDLRKSLESVCAEADLT